MNTKLLLAIGAAALLCSAFLFPMAWPASPWIGWLIAAAVGGIGYILGDMLADRVNGDDPDDP